MAAYTRCLRCAGAPRRPASGSGLSLLITFLACRPLRPRGVRHRYPETSMPTFGLRRLTTGSALPIIPQSVPRGRRFRGFTGSLPLRPARLLAPLYGSDWNVQPSGTFTSRLSTDRSPSPLLDITTTATGLLCWRDSHPLEWQLASLHGHSRPSHPAPKFTDVRYAPKATVRHQNVICRYVPTTDITLILIEGRNRF